jgi:hypothetical protein
MIRVSAAHVAIALGLAVVILRYWRAFAGMAVAAATALLLLGLLDVLSLARR